MESHIKKAGVLVGQVDTKLDAGRLAGMKRMADFSDRGLAKKMFRNNVVENEPAADVSAGDGAINIHISGQAPVFNPYPRKPKKKLDEELDEERRWSGIYDILFITEASSPHTIAEKGITNEKYSLWTKSLDEL